MAKLLEVPLFAKPRPHAQTAGTFVDLFAGCGGISLGLELAGFKPIYVNELNNDAMETYLLNRPGHPDLARFQSHDIFSLTQARGELSGLRSGLLGHYGLKDIDLVVGGPPCQGFSKIGQRRSFSVDRRDAPSNHLYREMAKVIDSVRPRLFMFENVRGLVSSRWTADGQPGEIWDDVRAAFGQIRGYDTYPHFLRAKDYGVPQNRPRVFIVGIRSDVGSVQWGRFAGGLLPEPSGVAPDPEEFLGDLVDEDFARDYVTISYPRDPWSEIQRWYRTDPASGAIRAKAMPISEHAYSHHSPRIVDKFRDMITTGGLISDDNRTKKFRQRVLPAKWGPRGPSITATSLPDDYVHFCQPRTLSVREWARMQTFPDWYQFAGQRTTGGRRRAGDPSMEIWERQVPKYTQIGNAVPVLLARAIGDHFRQLLA